VYQDYITHEYMYMYRTGLQCIFNYDPIDVHLYIKKNISMY